MNKERRIWVWLSGAFIALVLFLAFIPLTFAQNGGKASQYGIIFDEMMRFIKSYYVEDVDEKTLFEGAMKGMFESLGDPYSVFMNEEEMDSLSDTTTGQFGGVGLYISKHYGDTSFDEKHLPYVRLLSRIPLHTGLESMPATTSSRWEINPPRAWLWTRLPACCGVSLVLKSQSHSSGAMTSHSPTKSSGQS